MGDSSLLPVIIIYAFIFAFACLFVAGAKNRSAGWFFGGALLGIIGLLILAASPSLPARGQEPELAEPTGPGDVATRLAQIAQLHEQGALSDDEFAAAKRKVLG